MPTPPPPQHCPTAAELDDLELLATGALAPLAGFNQAGSAITLTLPPETAVAAAAAGAVELVDPEGLPLARVSWPGGAVSPLAHAEYGPFRALGLTPSSYRQQHAGRTIVPVTGPLSVEQIEDLSELGGRLTLLALVGTGTPSLTAPALVRASLATARRLPDAVVVTVPLASHGDPDLDVRLAGQVVANYAAGDPVRPVGGATADGVHFPPEISAIIEHDQPAPAVRGLVVFFTGLSGSGKSTLARALVDRLLEQGTRTVTSLDGDVVRRHLSAGLGFSPADRETNILRIGWVAAEIARHRGVAVVSPIAPYDATREQVRSMVEAAGGAFFLVHVATPLEECERRDRKGLYARARAGEIPDFTGISAPYEVPEDPDVRVDTTGRSVESALGDVLVGLRAAGYADLGGDGPAPLRVLFVCTANICRSPALELMAGAAVGDARDIVFRSAGTHGYADSPIDRVMAAALPAGVDPSRFRSRAITPEIVADADLILTAATSHRDFLLDEYPSSFRKVFTLGQAGSQLSAAPVGLDRAQLVGWLGENRGVADPAMDVADPYGRGTNAAAQCVEQLRALLQVVLDGLAKGPHRAQEQP